MSKPPVNPEKSVSGIAIDPRTLQRVIPESRRPDGSLRKEMKIRPGFTPQEDVSRFRGSRQQQMDHNALPKGHILGWLPPSETKGKTVKSSSATGLAASSLGDKPSTKSAAKNAKRKAKKQAEKGQTIKDSWEDDDASDSKVEQNDMLNEGNHSPEAPDWAKAPPTKRSLAEDKKGTEDKGATDNVDGAREADTLAGELQKLEMR